MQGEDDLRGLAKIMAFMRGVSIIIVLMHFYWFCYGVFAERGWTLEIIGKILTNFNRTAGLFSKTIYTKIFCAGIAGFKLPRYKAIVAVTVEEIRARKSHHI